MKTTLRMTGLLVAISLFSGCQSIIHPSSKRLSLDEKQILSTDGISQAISSLELSISQNKTDSEIRIAELKREMEDRQEQMRRDIDETNKLNEELMEEIFDTATGLAGAAGGSFAGTLLGSAISGSFDKYLISKKPSLTVEFQDRLKEIEDDVSKAKDEVRDELLTELSSVVKLSDTEKQDFRREILKEAESKGLPQDQIDSLKGMSDEQLIGLVGGGGSLGVLALAALLRTFGRSRSQKEIDELWDKYSDIRENIARRG